MIDSVVSLSAAQMQRVALARSLVYQHQLLMLDEPIAISTRSLPLRLRDDLRRIKSRPDHNKSTSPTIRPRLWCSAIESG